jgi:4-aminobutyrate aminotransferase-like enzyme
LATISVIEPLLPTVRAKGAEVLTKLREGWASVGVRGIGYMIGIELSSAVVAKRVQAQCLSRGLIVLLCGSDDRVIRLIPPLTISEADLNWGINILESSLIAGILQYSC